MSLSSQPCVLVAAIVVSDIIERLSPNIAPLTTAPRHNPILKPVFSLIPIAIGASADIVPTLVPIDIDIKQPIINIPTMAILPGINESPRLTVLSTPPAALIVPENAPAARNTRHMVIIFSSASPLAISDIFSLKVTLRFCTNATASAIRNATIAGIL